MSYGFPIINFCNPEVHFEAPYINGSTVLRSTFDQKLKVDLGIKLRLGRGETRHVYIGKRIDKNADCHK